MKKNLHTVLFISLILLLSPSIAHASYGNELALVGMIMVLSIIIVSINPILACVWLVTKKYQSRKRTIIHAGISATIIAISLPITYGNFRLGENLLIELVYVVYGLITVILPIIQYRTYANE